MPLVGASRRIEHDDAAIAVAVGDIDFVGVLVDRGLAELRGVARTLARRDLSDLHHELAIERAALAMTEKLARRHAGG